MIVNALVSPLFSWITDDLIPKRQCQRMLKLLHEVMGPDAMIFVFWMLSFKPTFSLSSFTLIKRLCISSSLSAIRVVSSAYLRLLIFLLAILIPACASSSPVFLTEWLYQFKFFLRLDRSFSTFLLSSCYYKKEVAFILLWNVCLKLCPINLYKFDTSVFTILILFHQFNCYFLSFISLWNTLFHINRLFVFLRT